MSAAFLIGQSINLAVFVVVLWLVAPYLRKPRGKR